MLRCISGFHYSLASVGAHHVYFTDYSPFTADKMLHAAISKFSRGIVTTNTCILESSITGKVQTNGIDALQYYVIRESRIVRKWVHIGMEFPWSLQRSVKLVLLDSLSAMIHN